MKVILLTSVSEIDDLVGLKFFESVKHGRQVSGGVVTGTVAFANVERVGALIVSSEFFNLVVPDDQGSVAFFGEANLGEFIVDALYFIAVEGFAEGDVNFDAHLHEQFFKGDF